MFGSLFPSFDSGLFDEVKRLESQMDQLFGRSSWPASIRAARRGAFPPVNVGATADRVDVYLFAAGLDPKNIDITIQQNLLVISGGRKLETREDAEYYRRERYDGDFRRVITLPEDIDPDRVEAKYRDGILQVTVQRRESAKPRQINVN